MKNNFFFLFLFLAALASCHSGRTTTIIENNDHYHLKIKYSGFISFTDDSSSIKTISSNGYIEYKKNSQEMKAASNNDGVITYTLHDEDEEVNPATDKGKQMISSAVHNIIKHTKASNPN